ncbi:MAG: hypothetical protein R3D59_18030 [Paracoccaceae bacterium]
MVAVFPIRVKRLLTDWPERADRKRRWYWRRRPRTWSPSRSLRQIIRHFNPRALR